LLLAMLALAVPPAYAISDEALNSLTATAGPSAISVSTSLDSCGIIDDGVVCKLDVSFNSIPNADSYSATVTRADGSVIDYGTVSPGGTSLWVPYVGAGNYSVKVTAYGEPDSPDDRDGRGDVIATGYSPDVDRGGKHRDNRGNGGKAEEGNVDTGVISNGSDGQPVPNADGAPSTGVGSSATETTTPECTTPVAPTEPLTPPEEPPVDTDPDNPDEDADGIPDDQEQVIYDQQMAEYQAAVQTQAAADASAC
jgi:hypothetical protein